ncbi:zinc finger HIT domain-containing protein 3 isoform X2 [Hyla sarda]|uniref:zinc finger HIT domain-containing protein 3 isoform X2 n=1 Tax=Hyla sarda TaxID=327740 RepID=UPI0024C2B211|nr:zinc finger HIT domain-containing protein 3 isoform X2 [Hyla sarda]
MHVFPVGGRSCKVNMEDSCSVCSVKTAKYRCPRCMLRYCSLGCSKKHKGCAPKEAIRSSHLTSLPEVLQRKDDDLEENDELDAVPMQNLVVMGKSEELKDLLLNTHLRQLIVTLDQTEHKDEALKKYMQEPLFVEFADKCLSLVEAEGKKGTLT